MQCAESTRMHAYFDAELDESSRAEMAQHIAACSECRAQLTELAGFRKQLRETFLLDTASSQLHTRIAQSLDTAGEASSHKTQAAHRKMWKAPTFWLGAMSGMGAAAVSAVFGFLFITAQLADPLLDAMVASHVRSLSPGQLIAVESTDRHTVKPWFAGRADVSPVVADFDAQGYRLIGGRVDALDQQRSAILVYRHGAHVINVFSWSAKTPFAPRDTTRNGYHIACWRSGNLDYCALSDTGWEELRRLELLLRDLGDQEQIDRAN